MAQTRATAPYVSQPTDELLAVLAIEAERAGAVVIGEDLGTVAPGVRRSARIGQRAVHAACPVRAAAAEGLAAEGHGRHHYPRPADRGRDLDRSADFADQARAGVQADRRGLALLRRRLARVAGLPPDAPLADVIEGVHAAVGAAPSVLAVATWRMRSASGVARTCPARAARSVTTGRALPPPGGG